MLDYGFFQEYFLFALRLRMRCVPTDKFIGALEEHKALSADTIVLTTHKHNDVRVLLILIILIGGQLIEEIVWFFPAQQHAGGNLVARALFEARVGSPLKVFGEMEIDQSPGVTHPLKHGDKVS